jgi:transketolase
VALAFSRQGLPPQARDARQKADIARGGYVLADCDGEPDVTLIATGSEVHLATGAAERLGEAGVAACVVSMPCVERFEAQDAAYRDAVLPRGGRRVVIEAGATGLWRGYVGGDGAVIGLDTFGESAPSGEVMKHFGFTVDHVVETARRVVGETQAPVQA